MPLLNDTTDIVRVNVLPFHIAQHKFEILDLHYLLLFYTVMKELKLFSYSYLASWYYQSFIYSPNDALVSCLKNSIKIYIKTAPKCFGVTVTPSSGSTLIRAYYSYGLNIPLKCIGVCLIWCGGVASPVYRTATYKLWWYQMLHNTIWPPDDVHIVLETCRGL